jgi:LDH2 family malate/lactate/ureidoglycolate dehydrogenase
MNDVTLSAESWREIGRRIFCAWGAPEDIAACVANSLVDSDLAGIYSHGVIRVADYIGYVKTGWWRPEYRPEIVRETPTTTVVDGHYGYGQPAAHLALDTCNPQSAHFTDEEQFYTDVDGLFDRLETVKPAPGFAQVMIPGAPEMAQRAKRSREGITVDGAIWKRIATATAERQVDLGDILAA